MIYAVDFDGTLSLGEWPGVGPANKQLIDFLLRRQRLGDQLILWTCRNGSALTDAVEFCKRQGLYFDAVNDNLPEIVEKYGSNSRKITCDVYIDDKACHVDNYERIGAIDMDRIASELIKFADRMAAAV